MRVRVTILVLLGACAWGGSHGGTGDDDDTRHDASTSGDPDGNSSSSDGSTGTDGANGGTDASTTPDAPLGVITGGPCMSGTAGATAYRIKWINAGGHAQVVYEKNGLPDHSRDHAAAYGYQIGFQPQFVDPFLGDGGLQLDSSDFVDIELTTVGVASISNATLSIYGRSFNTTTSGSFNWQTFEGIGSSPTNSVSNVAPYHWYAANMTTEISGGDANVLIRIKAGPSSGVLVVHRIEICMQAI